MEHDKATRLVWILREIRACLEAEAIERLAEQMAGLQRRIDRGRSMAKAIVRKAQKLIGTVEGNLFSRLIVIEARADHEAADIERQCRAVAEQTGAPVSDDDLLVVVRRFFRTDLPAPMVQTRRQLAASTALLRRR